MPARSDALGCAQTEGALEKAAHAHMHDTPHPPTPTQYTHARTRPHARAHMQHTHTYKYTHKHTHARAQVTLLVSLGLGVGTVIALAVFMSYKDSRRAAAWMAYSRVPEDEDGAEQELGGGGAVSALLVAWACVSLYFVYQWASVCARASGHVLLTH